METLFTMKFYKDDSLIIRAMQTMAKSEEQALIRLGQVYGDKEDKETKITLISIIRG